MNILYLGWIGFGNVGDDLMFHNFKRLIQDKYGKGSKVIPLYPTKPVKDFSGYDMVVLGGGSVLLEGYIDVLYDALKANKKIMVWGSGYDEMLGKEFIDKIENSKIPPYIYSDNHEEKLNEIAKKAEFFGVRGPLTYKLLEKSFVDMENIIISGDPGFLLEEESLDDKGTNLKFTKEDNVVAINLGGTYNRIFGGKESVVTESIQMFCEELLDKGYKLYLYAMWDEDLKIVVDLYRKLPYTNDIILDMVLHPGGELLSILKNCRFSINFKLHGNITSATANTPFICIGYRLKCFDFIKSLDLEELIVSTDSVDLLGDIRRTFDYMEKNEENIKSRLNEKIIGYRKLLVDKI